MSETIESIARRARVNITKAMEQVKHAKYANEQEAARLNYKLARQHLKRCNATLNAKRNGEMSK